MSHQLNHQNQLAEIDDAEVFYCPDYLDFGHQDQIYQRLYEQISWRQDSIKVYGKTHPIPRLQCWMADPSLEYRYSGLSLKAEPWHPVVDELRDKLASDFNVHFNSVLLNLYRDGQDTNGWHSDNEPELGKQPIIASISLGGERDFRLRQKQTKQSVSVKLESGSLLWMQGDTQTKWQHCLPRRAKAEPRINLTFRQIIT